jgi:chromosome segregation ATPase
MGAMRNMTRAVGIAATKWKALDTVMKTTVIGAVVAAIAGAVLVFHRLNKAMTGVTESQRNLNKVNQQALGDAQAQRAKIDSLISVYADEAEATDNRKAALSQLREVLGPHLKELDDQKIKLQDLKTAADNFTQSLIAQSKVTGITNLLSDANTELAELQKRLEMGQTIGGRAALGAQLIDEIFGTEQTERSVQKRINQLTKDIEHYQNQLTEAIQSQSALLTGAKPTGTPDLDLDLDTDQQPSSHPLVKTFDFIKFKTEGVKRDVRQIVDTITKKHETERGALAAISEQKAEEARQMKENIAGMAEAMNDFSQASDGLEMIREQMQAIDSFARSMGDAFIQTFEKIIQGGQKFGQFMKNMFLGIIKKALRALVITLALRAIGGGSLVGSFKEVFNTVAGLDKLFGFAGAKEVVPGAQRGAFIGGSGLVNLHPNEAVIPLSDPKAVNKIVSGLKRHGAGQATSPFKDGQILNVLRADMIFQLWKEGARQSGYMGGVGMQFNVS